MDDWQSLCDWVQEFVLSEPGLQNLERTRNGETAAQSTKEANQRQQEAAEAVRLLDRKSLWGAIDDLGNPMRALETISIDQRLGHEELVLVSFWVEAIHAWGEFARSPACSVTPLFLKATAGFPEFFELSRSFSKVFDPNSGAILDSASPELRAVRVQLRQLRQELQSRISNLAQGYERSGVLQSAKSDQIDGQYLLAVKASRHAEVPGSYVYASSSGQTVFIEPGEDDA